MSAPELAAGVVRDRIEWVLALVNGGGGMGEIPEVFAPSFLAVFKPEAIESLVAQQLRPAGPFVLEQIVSQSSHTAELVVRGESGLALTMRVALDAMVPNMIVGLGFQPYRSAETKPSTWSELDERVRAAAPDVALLVAEVVHGTCRTVHAIEPDRVLPLGSAFKLYVLGALASEVAAGRLSWDDTVVVTDAARVHSSLLFSQKPSGSEVTLREAATAMISISDNTATDLVMDRVGVEVIEEQQSILGMSDPSRNLPFLTTRDLTRLKWLVGEDARAAYVTADLAERRRIVGGLPDESTVESDLSSVVPTSPVAIRELEWFASTADLGRVHVALHGMGHEVRRILSVNPGQGLDFDRERWPYIGFKGGSEPGVLAMSWLAERSDGRVFVVAAQLCNDTGQVLNDVVVDVATAFDLLATIE